MMDFLENHVQTRERASVEAALQQVNDSLKRARASITEMNNPLTHENRVEKALKKRQELSTLRKSLRDLNAVLLEVANKKTPAV